MIAAWAPGSRAYNSSASGSGIAQEVGRGLGAGLSGIQVLASASGIDPGRQGSRGRGAGAGRHVGGGLGEGRAKRGNRERGRGEHLRGEDDELLVVRFRHWTAVDGGLPERPLCGRDGAGSQHEDRLAAGRRIASVRRHVAGETVLGVVVKRGSVPLRNCPGHRARPSCSLR
jgi:hypothetical protein